MVDVIGIEPTTSSFAHIGAVLAARAGGLEPLIV